MSKSYYKKTYILNWNKSSDKKLLINSLKENEISITSTDTIYGFLSNTTQESFNKLTKLKGARSDKPFIVLINKMSKLQHFVKVETISEKIDNLLKNCWPGPLTVIFQAKENLPKFLKSKTNTIAIRIPKHDGLISILDNFDGLFSTSGNRSGQKPPVTVEDIDESLFDEIAYLVDQENKNVNKVSSTIIDCSNLGEIKILRLGAYSKNIIEKYYGSKL